MESKKTIVAEKLFYTRTRDIVSTYTISGKTFRTRIFKNGRLKLANKFPKDDDRPMRRPGR